MMTKNMKPDQVKATLYVLTLKFDSLHQNESDFIVKVVYTLFMIS